MEKPPLDLEEDEVGEDIDAGETKGEGLEGGEGSDDEEDDEEADEDREALEETFEGWLGAQVLLPVERSAISRSCLGLTSVWVRRWVFRFDLWLKWR